jgi:hypothetical protein
MRILITGYTTRMWGSNRTQGDYVTFSFLLEEILKSMGHEVHRRQILIGEHLFKEYDFAFCGVAPLNSMTSGRVCETHYALQMMKGRCCIYADDWSFCDFANSLKGAVEKWQKYLDYKKFPYDRKITDNTKEHLEQLLEYNESNNPPVLAPMFPWGNHRFLMHGVGKGNISAKLITVDPSRWLNYPSVDISRPLERKRHWVMAALSDHSSWIKKQNFKMPVLTVGNRRTGIVLTEADTVRLFADSFGVLATGYPSAGSGWWRTRYLNAAWAEAILYCDPRDQFTMGLPYHLTVTHAEQIESEKEYEAIAQSQSDWLMRNISQKETTIAILERLIAK